jgi:hypothetical protein
MPGLFMFLSLTFSVLSQFLINRRKVHSQMGTRCIHGRSGEAFRGIQLSTMRPATPNLRGHPTAMSIYIGSQKFCAFRRHVTKEHDGLGATAGLSSSVFYA